MLYDGVLVSAVQLCESATGVHAPPSPPPDLLRTPRLAPPLWVAAALASASRLLMANPPGSLFIHGSVCFFVRCV